MTSVFHQLLQTQSFVDVSLACEDNTLKAHKVKAVEYAIRRCKPNFRPILRKFYWTIHANIQRSYYHQRYVFRICDPLLNLYVGVRSMSQKLNCRAGVETKNGIERPIIFTNKIFEVLLRHAIECFDFAYNYRGKYSDNVYKSPENDSWAYQDELLYTPHGFGWDDKLAGAVQPEYVTAARNFCSWIRNDATKTPLGLIFLGDWGSLRSISTVAFACLQAAEMGIDTESNRAMARSQIGYALGDTGRSFVVGFGVNPPSRPHHRASSCPSLPLPCDAINSPDPNPQTFYGALVGGTGYDDSYVDDRLDYVKNEVALDYNAGFQSAIAGMISLKNRGLL